MLPVATNLRIIKTPWATYAIVITNTVIHLLVTWNTNFIISDRVVRTFGFVPASVSNLNLLAIPTLVTSMFLHGDLLHLFGNMVFLLVFGRRVENQLERINFLTFYLTAGITACLAHMLMEPDSSVPLIGASGAISGVLGAFFICNPRARITLVLEPILIYFLCRLTIHLPAWIFLAIWFFMQISMGLKQHGSNVAFWAHVGGFLAGVLMSVVIYKYIPRSRPCLSTVEHRDCRH
jgi:membrane associated rhomboid family serine protease